MQNTALPTQLPTQRLDGRGLLALAVILFLVGTALHIFWGWFPKSIDVMPDEMRYLDTARSLFSGDGLVLRGESGDVRDIANILLGVRGVKNGKLVMTTTGKTI